MSAPVRSRRTTIADLMKLKGVRASVVLAAYTAPMAGLLDPHVDCLLVGDSLGMVLYGFETTLPVTLEMMIAHGAAVVRGSSKALVVVDMPFASYQESPQQAFRNAARIMAETGAGAVKLEGGEEMAETIQFLTLRGVPVMGHIGLTPQSFNTLGGYKTQGKSQESAAKLLRDAEAIVKAGAFSFVLEGTIESVSDEIAASSPVPVIGIGASAQCDGQVLVSEDMLGIFNEFTPRFVKRFGELGLAVGEAAARYAEDVKTRAFPGPEHVFKSKP